MKTDASAIEFKIQHSTFKNFDLHPLITYPGLTQEMLDYEIQVIRKFFERIFLYCRLLNP
jgi:hypothetical protein